MARTQQKARMATAVVKRSHDFFSSDSNAELEGKSKRQKPINSAPVKQKIEDLVIPEVKPDCREKFAELCKSHGWAPQPAVRTKLGELLHLSEPKLDASELLPLAFVQFYPFLWSNNTVFLGHTLSGEEVWYKVIISDTGGAGPYCYNKDGVPYATDIRVASRWSSFDKFVGMYERDTEKASQALVVVYRILEEFPNLRYHGPRLYPNRAIRSSGIPEYPFNADHPLMAENQTAAALTTESHNKKTARIQVKQEQSESNVSETSKAEKKHDGQTIINQANTPNTIARSTKKPIDHIDLTPQPLTTLPNQVSRAKPALMPHRPIPSASTTHEVQITKMPSMSQSFDEYIIRIPITRPALNFTFSKPIETVPAASDKQASFAFAELMHVETRPVTLSRLQMLHSLVDGLVKPEERSE